MLKELLIKLWRDKNSFNKNLMCRNIKQLFNFEPPASSDEIKAKLRNQKKFG